MRTQADCDDDLSIGRELERKDAQIDQLRAALAPFAKGAGQIPAENWPDHRALLIDEKHPDNPKKHCLLLARVGDFRRAAEVLNGQGTRAGKLDTEG